jgi:hypothetical protein
MSDKQTVRRRKVVTMEYSLCNTEGVVVREAGAAPVTCLHGVGGLFTRLEQELENHAVGDIVTARLLPDDAFGIGRGDPCGQGNQLITGTFADLPASRWIAPTCPP